MVHMNKPSPEFQAKATLRKELLASRAGLPVATREKESHAVCDTLHPLCELTKQVAGFHSFGDEINLIPLIQAIWETRHRVWLPRVEGDSLSFHPVGGEEELSPGALGIPEPRRDVFPATVALPKGLSGPHLTVGGARQGPFAPRHSLMIVPGLAFGVDGRRLGYGRGYYDRVLAALGKEWITVGVGFSFQRCDDLPEGPADRRVDGVLLGGDWVKPIQG